MFPVTITLQNQQQLQAVLNALALKAEEPAPVAAPVKADAQPAAPEPVPAPAAAAPTYDELKKLVIDKTRVNRDAVLAVLTRFGVKRAPELKEAQYAEVMEALNAAC